MHQCWKVSLIAHVETHSEDAGERRYGVQVGHGEASGERGDGDGGEEERTAEVGGDHHRSAAQAIGPCAREQAEQKDAGRAHSAEIAHLKRRRAEDKDRGEG